MNTNNRNVRLQEHVVLLTVMEHAEHLIIIKKNSHTSLTWRNVNRNVIEWRRYRVWTSRMYSASNWTSRFSRTADTASFLNNQSCEIHTYSLLSAPLFTQETRRLKNVRVCNTSAMIVKISTGFCRDYFYQHERKVYPRTSHEGPEGE